MVVFALMGEQCCSVDGNQQGEEFGSKVAQSQENFAVAQFGPWPTGLRLKHLAKFPFNFWSFIWESFARSPKSTHSS